MAQLGTLSGYTTSIREPLAPSSGLQYAQMAGAFANLVGAGAKLASTYQGMQDDKALKDLDSKLANVQKTLNEEGNISVRGQQAVEQKNQLLGELRTGNNSQYYVDTGSKMLDKMFDPYIAAGTKVDVATRTSDLANVLAAEILADPSKLQTLNQNFESRSAANKVDKNQVRTAFGPAVLMQAARDLYTKSFTPATYKAAKATIENIRNHLVADPMLYGNKSADTALFNSVLVSKFDALMESPKKSLLNSSKAIADDYITRISQGEHIGTNQDFLEATQAMDDLDEPQLAAAYRQELAGVSSRVSKDIEIMKRYNFLDAEYTLRGLSKEGDLKVEKQTELGITSAIAGGDTDLAIAIANGAGKYIKSFQKHNTNVWNSFSNISDDPAEQAQARKGVDNMITTFRNLIAKGAKGVAAAKKMFDEDTFKSIQLTEALERVSTLPGALEEKLPKNPTLRNYKLAQMVKNNPVKTGVSSYEQKKMIEFSRDMSWEQKQDFQILAGSLASLSNKYSDGDGNVNDTIEALAKVFKESNVDIGTTLNSIKVTDNRGVGLDKLGLQEPLRDRLVSLGKDAFPNSDNIEYSIDKFSMVRIKDTTYGALGGEKVVPLVDIIKETQTTEAYNQYIKDHPIEAGLSKMINKANDFIANKTYDYGTKSTLRTIVPALMADIALNGIDRPVREYVNELTTPLNYYMTNEEITELINTVNVTDITTTTPDANVSMSLNPNTDTTEGTEIDLSDIMTIEEQPNIEFPNK